MKNIKKAYNEFELCRQLKVTASPAVFVQLNETKFYMVAPGYTDFETQNERIRNVLKENKISVL